jgi:hypothetical protein
MNSSADPEELKVKSEPLDCRKVVVSFKAQAFPA